MSLKFLYDISIFLVYIYIYKYDFNGKDSTNVDEVVDGAICYSIENLICGQKAPKSETNFIYQHLRIQVNYSLLVFKNCCQN